MKLKTRDEKIDEMYDFMIEMRTHWNGGPGSWEVCKAHTASLEKGAKRIAWLNWITTLAIGAGGRAM